jgi:hypothetical protein
MRKHQNDKNTAWQKENCCILNIFRNNYTVFGTYTLMKILKMSMSKKMLPSLFLILFICGAAAGVFVKSYLERSLIQHQSRFILLMNVPVQDVYTIFKAVSDQDVGTRIAAYYASGDMNSMSLDFLLKRFDKENELAAKRTILFVIKNIDLAKYAELVRKYPQFAEKKGFIVKERLQDIKK